SRRSVTVLISSVAVTVAQSPSCPVRVYVLCQFESGYTLASLRGAFIFVEPFLLRQKCERRGSVRVIRRSAQVHSMHPTQPAIAREKYFFYEKNTGVSHFHVESDEQGRFPVEQAAGLLAMHCMVRNQSPEDYVVMIEADCSQLAGLTEKAQKLLEAGRSVKSHVKLTRR